MVETDGYLDNVPVFTVAELSQSLKRTVEDQFSFVRVRAEISGFKRAASGHLYFALKDEAAVLDGVCWKGTANRLGLRPEDGMEVIATGRLSTYPGRSKYQMVVEGMELAGEGALLKLLEDRRKRLAAEGLFDPQGKQEIPFLPEVIGVITSPTGAVIRDILHRLADRFPRHVLLWPVVVQGEGAADQVARAILGFNKLDPAGPVPRPDVLIVARGGGSLEDLMAFNEEIVVRAAFESAIPVISAVGHETDTTLIDHAADLRAPTPTAAAEMAVPVRRECLAQVMEDGARLLNAVERRLDQSNLRLDAAARGLPKPDRLVGEARQRLDDWSERLSRGLVLGQDRRRQRFDQATARLRPPAGLIQKAAQDLASESRAMDTALTRRLERAGDRLERAGALLESYSFGRVLDRGFALVRDSEGKPVLSSKATRAGEGLTVQFRDGVVDVLVAGKGAAAPRKTTAKRSKPKTSSNEDQGTLL
ncbi:MAG: exodeoxyribonuclease VII large subunit [Magnetovibrionaceae bacterium]